MCAGAIAGALSLGHNTSGPTVNVSPSTTAKVSPSTTPVSTYRAFETLVAQDSRAITPEMVRTASSANFAATVARLGGSARFSIRWDLPAAAVRVITTSPVRDDANRTLAVVDSVLRQKLLDAQDPGAWETLTQHNA